ncbi:putative membrane protein YfcA [Pseudorhizobium tarimense]|uniref:Probable membrane transporter protein n=1 Tax=Pseudorhizobium tarimense TaxID=1079109 RepID=A0ABV2HBM5_9HYPH|nr:sulfite exporter TauE/SafE family protein [Pseudorhizobium tarimense]MCJ8520895.1 sulfite exporter TauE/SafE family protein [Pseudorhizobium tarimense]
MIPSLFLPDGMTETVFGILVGSSFISSLITVAFGIGGGGILLAVMATLVPPAALIPTHGVIQVGSNLGRAIIVFKHIFWPAIPAFAVGSIIGAAIGGSIVVNLPPALVQIGVGSFVIWSVFARPPEGLRNWPLLVGGISSFLTMFFGATGLFVATFTKSHKLPRHSHVATHATLMTVQHGVKSMVFGLLGFTFAHWWAFIISMMFAGLAGTLVGKSLLNKIDDRRFRFMLDAVLVILSARLIYAGFNGLS